MLAIDTNILVHAHRREYSTHDAARRALARAASGRWALPWPCVHEFLAVVTHPKIFRDPTPAAHALAQVRGWLNHPSCRPIGETDDHLDRLAELATAAEVRGPRFHDARIAAICLAHGVSELWTVDRDFGRFGELTTRNPLLEA